MKTIRQVVFFITMGIFNLMGCSCEPESLDGFTQGVNYIPNDPVPDILLGEYVPKNETGEPVVIITPDVVELRLQEYSNNIILANNKVRDNAGCWITIYLADGTEVRLKYTYMATHEFISVSVWLEGVRHDLGAYEQKIILK